MIRTLIHWYLRQIAALLQTGGVPDGAVILAAGADDAAPALARRRRGRLLARRTLPLGAGRRPVVRALVLAEPTCLVRDVVMPLAAEADLAGALRYQMDSLTPFRAEEVFWTWSITARERTAGRLGLRLMLLPRAWVVPLLERLAAQGYRPAALELSLPGGGGCRVALGPDRSHRLARGGAAVCVALGIAALLAPVLRQSFAMDAAETRIEAMRPVVTEVTELRRRLTAKHGQDALSAARAHSGDALRILARVTGLLGDDTFLTGFSLRARRLTLEGQSGAAARLLAALATDPAIRNPVFTAPVLRGEQRQDLFALQAELAE